MLFRPNGRPWSIPHTSPIDPAVSTRRPYVGLLLALCAWNTTTTLIPPTAWRPWVNAMLLVAVLLQGSWAATRSRRDRAVLIVLAGVVSGLSFLIEGVHNLPVIYATLGSIVLLLMAVAVLITLDVLRAEVADAQVLSGGASVYLLIATLWSVLFIFVELVNPGSFLEQGAPVRDEGWATYYSLVTLTTLGFGDIVPVSRAARLATVSEAALGQLYLAIFVGRLVGLGRKESSHKAAESPDLPPSPCADPERCEGGP